MAFCHSYNTSINKLSNPNISDSVHEYCEKIYNEFKNITKSTKNKAVNWRGTTTNCISAYSWAAALGVILYALFFAVGTKLESIYYKYLIFSKKLVFYVLYFTVVS